MRVQDRTGLWQEPIDRKVDQRLSRRLAEALQDLGIVIEFEKVRFIELALFQARSPSRRPATVSAPAARLKLPLVPSTQPRR